MSNNLLESVELSRISARDQISENIKKLEEQYFTPARVARIMAQLFTKKIKKKITVLDPCSGVGNLAAAVYQYGIENKESQTLTLIERDNFLYEASQKNFRHLKNFNICNTDFFDSFASLPKFDRIILNPPYAKLKTGTKTSDQCVQNLGHSEPNLYSAFISHCVELLTPEGELVAIVPRSFCNGPLFKNFRKSLHKHFFFHEFYLFESRKIFSDSNVLQEVIIIKIGRKKSDIVRVSHEGKDGCTVSTKVPIDKIIFPTDPTLVIHIPVADRDQELLSSISKFANTLGSIGLKASTGKVVDFRCEKFLRIKKTTSCTNLVYQDNVVFSELVNFSKLSEKPGFISVTNESRKLLINKKNYILVRRISFKESPTRIIASPLLEHQFTREAIGIENHLNYIWGEKHEISYGACLALTAYLSSKTIDRYVRRFSGHTQINATDLNSLPVPELRILEDFQQQNANLNIRQLIEISDEFFFGDTL